MKVLVIGSGGREHAIAWKLSRSPKLGQLYCAPGNAGTAQIAQNVPILPHDLQGLLRFARSEGIDLTVVGPEAPLVAGIANLFQKADQLIVGPSREAALLEGSKAFAKRFLTEHGIPTADYGVYHQAEAAEAALRAGTFPFPLVLKADGLAAGKGVFVCSDLAESLKALNAIMGERRFGEAGDILVIEEFLEGEETSFMIFTDGTTVLPMIPSRDHKAIYDGDRGPNTGGMGAFSSDAILPQTLRQQILDDIIQPTVHAMAGEGRPYCGILYAGLMLTRGGTRVLEFNVRFGDPETQVVLPRMESDLLEILLAVAQGNLQDITLRWDSSAVVCVVLAARGYPASYEKGKQISGLEMVSEEGSALVFHAATTVKNGRIVTDGGRVLGVASQAPELDAAILQAYEGVNKIHFEGMYYRRDIASKGLNK